jgi:hypothetical protein
VAQVLQLRQRARRPSTASLPTAWDCQRERRGQSGENRQSSSPWGSRTPSYNENVSVFLQSGPYVLYFPDLYETPESFNTFIGKRPGMTVIDTDAYR